MKKIFCSLLCFSIIGCSTSSNVIPTKEVKVDSIKVNQVNVFDLGNKNGASVKANFSLGKEKSPFGIKTETNADLVGTIDCVKLFLYSVSNGDPAPDLTTRTTLGMFRDILVSSSNFSLTFSGLQPGKDYYVAAQAYSGGCTSGLNETSNDGLPSTTTGGGTAGAVGAPEEFISVSSAGVPNVQNEVSPYDNDSLDIQIQLRKSTNASVTGSANINNGDSADPEDITSP